MCGFLYTGADLSGFGDNSTEELALRWLALGIFNPLMRNHSALGTKDQEYFRYKNKDIFRNMLKLRYMLIPYLYSEYRKAVQNDDMMFKPLGFIYRGDKYAESIEDQLIIGDSIMIAPVYEANALGRYVYLPENMLMVRLRSDVDYECESMTSGHHFVEIPLNEAVIFIRQGKSLPIVKSVMHTGAIDLNTMSFITNNNGGEYELITEKEKKTIKYNKKGDVYV